MKYYLIYINNKFFAWSDDKNTIKDFKKLINKPINILKTNDRVLPRSLVNSLDFVEKELIYYEGYRYIDSGPIRICDMETLYGYILDIYLDFKVSFDNISHNIKYIDMPDNIKRKFIDILEKCIEISDDIITSDAECVYDEVINMDLVMKKYIREILNTHPYKQ